jgi:hypothetical protein
MYKQLDLFNKSQPSDLEKLDDMVSIEYYEEVASHGHIVEERMPFREEKLPPSQLDWDIQQAIDSGDHQRLHELYTIKNDMN